MEVLTLRHRWYIDILMVVAGPMCCVQIKSRGRSRASIVMIIILVEPRSEQPVLEVRYLPLWPSTYVTGPSLHDDGVE